MPKYTWSTGRVGSFVTNKRKTQDASVSDVRMLDIKKV